MNADGKWVLVKIGLFLIPFNVHQQVLLAKLNWIHIYFVTILILLLHFVSPSELETYLVVFIWTQYS